MMSFCLYVVVFISGASVLAVEIVGTRILGPFYGVSLFLWSALITVTLASLSLGYAIGGRWADRGARITRLGWLLATSGAWLLVVPWIRQPLLASLDGLGLRSAVLLASLILFAPPLTLLGMVSPYAIRLKASTLKTVGRTAGDLYAISTVASVVSALLTGFFLIPYVGVSRLLFLNGLLLIVGASLTFVVQGDARRRSAVLALTLACVGLGFLRAPSSGAEPHRGLLDVQDSAYSEIRVLDHDDVRFLLLDGGVHTMVDPITWDALLPYVPVTGLARLFFDAPGDLLLLGLGGGSIVKDFVRDGWQVDAVEIDPAVIQAAREHFGLEERECRLFCMDARRFLQMHDQAYDVIVMDAFGSSSIPFHLVTREAFGLAASRLQPEGLLAINVETRSWDDVLLSSLTATLREHFAEVIALPTSEPPNSLGNIVVLASQRPLDFPEDRLGHPQDYLDRGLLHWVMVQKNHAWDNRYEPGVAGAIILTDDRNPVDLWSEVINLTARRDLHDYFGRVGLGW